MNSKKGLSTNLKLVMVVVILMLTVVFVFSLASDNVNFLSNYGNSTINGSMAKGIP